MITAAHKGKYYEVEYSVVNVSELEGELRIDAEYYDPFYLSQIKKLISHNWMPLKKLLKEPIYNGFDYRHFEETGLPYVRVGNIKDFTIYLEETVKVNPPKIPKKILLELEDILLTRKGTVGEVAIIHSENLKKVIISSEIMKLSPDNSKIDPYYLMIFLKSYFGELQITQNIHGIAHVSITQEALENIKIPISSNSFQKFIEKLVLKAYEEHQKAEQLYKQAEGILLEELGLKNWKTKTKKIKIGGQEFEGEENISIRMLSDVIKTDRMDAEYWEPKYDDIENIIKNYKNGYDYLPNLVEVSKEKIRIQKDKIYHYIELADINPNLGVVNQTKEIIGKDLPSRARMKVKKGYVIMSSVKGSIDKIALIDFEKDNLVASTGFFVFKEKFLNKETLLVLLKILSKKYLIREAQGAILSAIPYDSLNRIILPKINQQIQQKISQLIQQSFKARENSKKLLEIAKKTVEIYIEKNEEEGLKYAKEKLKTIKLCDQ